MAQIWYSQIDRQIDIKIRYLETNRLNGIDMVLSDRQIDRYQNWISRDKQIEWHRYGTPQIDRQIDRQIDFKIRYPETNRLNGKDMVFSDSQIHRQIDRYQNWISRDKQIEWHRYGALRQIDRQIDRYQNQISRDKQIEWQTYGVLRQSDTLIDRQISKLDVQRQTD